MNRWLVPAVTVAAVALTAVASPWLPVASPPPVPAPPDTARLTVLCPSFDSATAFVRVAAAAVGPGLRTAPLSDPDTVDEPEGVAVLAGRAEPVLVSGRRDTTFGAVSLVSAGDGPDRGLSAVTCQSPATERWFTGVRLDEDAQAELVLDNIDSVEASVDVAIFGPDGRIASPGSRGLVVEARGSRRVPLGVLASVDGPVTLLVESSVGRVAASLRQRLWDGPEPRGSDWIPAAAAPATDLVVPGIAAGEGDRELVVANPGDRTASVAVELLGALGRSGLAGVENLEIPAGATRAFDLGPGLAGQSAGLRLTAGQPVTAAVRQSSATSPTQRDPAWAVALAPIGPDGLWPIAASTGATATLLLSNPSDGEQTVTVTLGNQLGGPGQTLAQRVPAGATVEVPIPEAETPVVRVQAEDTDVRGAIVVTRRVGRFPGLAVVGLVASQSATPAVPPVGFDPHAGS